MMTFDEWYASLSSILFTEYDAEADELPGNVLQDCFEMNMDPELAAYFLSMEGQL